MTAIIENDTLEGMPSMGTQIGGFLKEIAPGIGAFILIVGVFAGIVGIVMGIAVLIKKKVNM